MSDIFSNISVSVVAAMLATILGLISSLLSRFIKKRDTERKNEAEKILKAYSNISEDNKIRTLEKIVSELSEKSSDKNIEKQVSQILLNLDIQSPTEKDELKVIEDLISSYHDQALKQSTVQFWFSVIAATVGFGIILYMIFSAQNSTAFDTILKTLPGVAIEAVSALFFNQARETRKRATDLYDRLRTDKQQAKAISIANTIDDEKLKSAVLAQISLYMSGLTKTDVDSNKIISEVLALNQAHENKTAPNKE